MASPVQYRASAAASANQPARCAPRAVWTAVTIAMTTLTSAAGRLNRSPT